MLASETLAMLQPIFESLRADSENSSMFSFPMLTSSNVKFHKVNSLLRRTNLPRISVSQCHSVRNRMIKLYLIIHNIFNIIIWHSCIYSHPATIHQNHDKAPQQLILIIQIQLVLAVEHPRELHYIRKHRFQ